MTIKSIESDFGQFIFLDEHTVVAKAYAKENIDAAKVKHAIELIEKEQPGDYGIILDRSSTYSVMPVEVYRFFGSITRLKVMAIVKYREIDVLPENMEQKISGKPVMKFSAIDDAHEWVKTFF